MAASGQHGEYDNPAMLPDSEASTNETDETGSVSGIKKQSAAIGQSLRPGEPVELLSISVVSEGTAADNTKHNDSCKQVLRDFVPKKQGSKVTQHKSKKVRSYYKNQDRLIGAYEDLCKEETFVGSFDAVERSRKLATFYSKITFGVNLVLLAAKMAASILSGSMSIISSLVDSAVDLLSGIIMWWAARAIKKRDPNVYPQGRSKLEPISIVILSVVMGLASVQLIRESIEKIVTVSEDHSALPDMGISTFVIAGSTVVIKFVLWAVCRKVNSPIVQALALDHRNDVMSNSVAIVCGYLGSSNFQASTHLSGFIFTDPIGAISISLYIIYNWWRAGSEQIKLLTGHTADTNFLSKLTWIAMTHDPQVTHIETLRAYHYGNNYLVKVHIVLPESMTLRDSHDIGESLQRKLEAIPEVERAFVHVDYDYVHKPSSEHKVL